MYYTQNLRKHPCTFYRVCVEGCSTNTHTHTHMRTCIVAHIPLQAGPAHKGHHVALYSLWHEAAALPALHCPLPAGEHAPRLQLLFLRLHPSLSPSFHSFTAHELRWMCALAPGLRSEPKLKMNGCVFVMEYCWEISFPHLIVRLCFPPNFPPSSN